MNWCFPDEEFFVCMASDSSVTKATEWSVKLFAEKKVSVIPFTAEGEFG